MTDRPKTLTVLIGTERAVYFTGAFTVELEQHPRGVVLTVRQYRSERRFALSGDLPTALAKVRLAGEVVAHAELDD
ncbi:MAG: hypothetical protein WHS44_09900 [Fimbriimonadales bacterium]|nr:MAG: hypothetical protein KatS3mg018_0162 [Fimbriimonadales bacterium]